MQIMARSFSTHLQSTANETVPAISDSAANRGRMNSPTNRPNNMVAPRDFRLLLSPQPGAREFLWPWNELRLSPCLESLFVANRSMQSSFPPFAVLNYWNPDKLAACRTQGNLYNLPASELLTKRR